MSDHKPDCKAAIDRECGPCTCDPPAPRALTREQVDNIELFVKSEGERAVRILCSDVLMLTASHEAQRLTINRLEQEVERLQEACAKIAEDNTFMSPKAANEGNFGGPGSCEYDCGTVIARAIRKLKN